MKPIIGAHVSVAGGFNKGVDHALEIGAQAIQIFGASPQQWQAKMPNDETITGFKKRLLESGVGPVFLHAAYLVNLASPDDSLVAKSVKNLSSHLKIAELLGAQGLIFHIGSGKELPKEAAMKKVVVAMKEVLKNVPGKAQLIMENAAGGGQKIGTTATELGELMKKIGSSRVKVCIDTAHAFEAGAIQKYDAENIAQFFNEWGGEVGVENIVVLHANDSKTACGSHSDRHENIGEGYIGIDGFKNLARHPHARSIPWILEVPGFKDEGPDKKNIERLRACFL
jgi:deoxyribonuclease-4